jgi:chromosome segregation ATPase
VIQSLRSANELTASSNQFSAHIRFSTDARNSLESSNNQLLSDIQALRSSNDHLVVEIGMIRASHDELAELLSACKAQTAQLIADNDSLRRELEMVRRRVYSAFVNI